MGKENQGNDFFGNPRRIKEYRALFYSGVVLSIVGLFLFTFFTNYLSVYGMAFLFIGFMCIMAGFLGLREEFGKYGTARIETRWGKLALATGTISLFSAHSPPISLIFAVAAIILGKKAIKRGDNTYGKDGMICGIIALFIICYLLILEVFFIAPR